jgi:DNA repair photolyase
VFDSGNLVMMNSESLPIKGRGTARNPSNRFEELTLERDAEWNPDDDPAPQTHFFRDVTQTAIAYNDSPDIGFDASINPYRGCEHGCVYCYARPTHEFLGLSSGLDFETRIMVKSHVPELLRKELSSPQWKPQVIAMSGVTDCYQPIERKLKLTRRCLEVLAEFRNPVCIITKSYLVTRDIDVLSTLARYGAVSVSISVTTLNETLAPKLEPRASLPQHRLAAIEALNKAGIPVGVLVAPVIPALTDHEMPSILAAAAKAGAQFAGFTALRLPFSVSSLFEEWLAYHFPERKQKVLDRIRSIRGGRLNDPNFGSRMRGHGIFADQIGQMFQVACRKAGFERESPALSTAAFRIPPGPQMSLFD